MKEYIDTAEVSEYEDIVEVWEASVRATHHFLKEEDIHYFRPLILHEYLKVVNLSVARDGRHKIVGFLCVDGDKVEMLFIHPDARGKGVGKLLLNYAIHKLKVTKVDVNEDNVQAVGFYKNFNFKTISRSEQHSSGKPYPILHMEMG